MTNQPPAAGRGLIRLRAEIAYDGSMFAGWASQLNLRTVQREVEKALGIALHQPSPLKVIVAGRTDAGVHARGQVVHFDTPTGSFADLTKLTFSLNGLLPLDIRVHKVEIAHPEFDARFSAIARRYSYTISDGPADPLTRHSMYQQWRTLDVPAMQQAAQPLLGLHDFTSYCKFYPTRSSIRTLQRFDWERHGAVVTANLQADAFCHSMVRALVGAVLQVGQGLRPVEFPAQVLQRRRREADIETLPGHGLVLEEVFYPADVQLGTRAAETRARRDPSELSD